MNNLEQVRQLWRGSDSRRRLVVIALSLLPVLLTACAGPYGSSPPSSSSPSKPGTIVSTETHGSISKEELLERTSNADVVYVGEQHGNPGSHEVQFNVIKNLLEAGKTVSVGFELFREDHQPLLNDWRRGDLTRDEFKRRLETKGGNPEVVDYYRDILTLARKQELRLVALKPNRDAVNRLMKKDHGDTKASPGNDSGPQEQFLRGLFRKHPSTGRGFRSFVRVQKFWEDRMAQNIHRHLSSSRKSRTMVVLTGNLHVLYDFGIPEKLATRGNWSQLSIVTLPAQESLDEAFSYRRKRGEDTVEPADYVWWVGSTMESGK